MQARLMCCLIRSISCAGTNRNHCRLNHVIETMRPVTLVTPEIIELAKSMLAKGQDWSPEADKILSTDNSLCLCSYPDGAWIAFTHDEVSMDHWTKLECVIPLP